MIKETSPFYFRLPNSIPDYGEWPIADSLKDQYSLPVSRQDTEPGVNVRKILEKARDDLALQVDRAVKRSAESFAWGDEFVSLRDLPELQTRFNRFLGSIILPENLQGTPFGEFFNQPGRTYKKGSHLENRGARYFLPSDPGVGSVAEKLTVVRVDTASALATLSKIDQKTLTTETLLPYLGILDYLKQDSLALYHVLIQPDKEGNLELAERSREMQTEALNLATDLTRAYYLAALGRKITLPDFSQTISTVDRLSNYISQNLNDPTFFKLPEIDHPLTIMLFAHEVVCLHPHTSTIIALPRGSTQVGVATQLAFELFWRENMRPKLIMVPISSYSRTKTDLSIAKRYQDYLEKFAFQLKDRQILIVDDNSHSGVTLSNVISADKYFGSQNIVTAVAEIDPIRIINQYSSGQPPRAITNYLHPDFQSAMGFVPVTKHKTPENTFQYRKYLARKILLSGGFEKSQK